MKLLAEQRPGVVNRIIHKPERKDCSSAGFIPLMVCSGIKSGVKKEAFFFAGWFARMVFLLAPEVYSRSCKFVFPYLGF